MGTAMSRMHRLTVPVLAVAAGLVAVAGPPGQAAAGPTFDTPVISGIQGYGFEQSLRVAKDGTMYSSVPDSLASAASFIWRSSDGGRTFKWVPASAPFTGKPI